MLVRNVDGDVHISFHCSIDIHKPYLFNTRIICSHWSSSINWIQKMHAHLMCVHEKQKKSYQQSRKRWAINLMTPVNNLLSASFSVTLVIISLFVCFFFFSRGTNRPHLSSFTCVFTHSRFTICYLLNPVI